MPKFTVTIERIIAESATATVTVWGTDLADACERANREAQDPLSTLRWHDNGIYDTEYVLSDCEEIK